MTRPSVLGDVGDSCNVESVTVNVPNRGEQLPVGDDRDGVESPTKQRTISTHPIVDMSRVDP